MTPQPDTVSLAESGQSVDYINGYERGWEAGVSAAHAAMRVENTRLAYELQGVLADVRAGNGFDATCTATVTYVMNKLKGELG